MVEIKKEFLDTFGYSPNVIAAAPGRVNLIGEHIDYSDGFVLPFAINDRTYCAIGIRNDRKVRISSMQRSNNILEYSLDEIKPGLPGDWQRYPLGVIWAMQIENGIDIVIDGQVPLGAGLSSSAALECCVATALNQLFALGYSLQELARLTQQAENEYVGVPCGIMDQSVSLMARSGYALLLDCRDLTTRDIEFDLASSDLELLIIDTQTHHALTDGGYAERRAACESVVAKLGIASLRDLSFDQLESSRNLITEIEYVRARHAVTEILRVATAVEVLESKDFITLGKLLNESHSSLRDDYAVSCPELNCAVESALSAGALGARMVGGGFGGSAIALIQVARKSETTSAIEKAFANNGFTAPRFFTSLPSQGAEIIELALPK
uniref:galactokinase n=1 Tax=Candidatus Planktophila sp. TaxID=2175601 RepID=UPI00404B9802